MINSSNEAQFKESPLSAYDRQLIDERDFGAGKYKLSVDAINSLSPLAIISSARGVDEGIESVELYEEYVHRASKATTSPKEYFEYVMQKSDKARVAEYDEMVNAFNSDLSRIKKEKDIKAVDDFIAKAINLLRG